ncbi:Spx/MgsR family RNA polymerase-binding regulatory protein [Cohnella luojiensis]|uniref:Spx/MgsR family RNA polymerase-binding regulatory protein n=2 Tax=Cohnella luojiensis TaxID=652876 RepID=A0A4Y8M2Y2_9BACL|nr:Spx/MgsR family RNA polymerase-binding regulatory protein [Cohnella luojiensis]TFE28213.1 Spx/MgsR family RNA polymerase-binding regulatory protein [Cohnella luojiensis]
MYHLPTCSTCKSAIKALKHQGYELDLHDIKAIPPAADELIELIAMSGLPISKWFNVSGEVYREMGLKDKLSAMTDEEKIKLLSSNGMLIKRPIVSDGSKVTIGFREQDFGPVWYRS